MLYQGIQNNNIKYPSQETLPRPIDWPSFLRGDGSIFIPFMLTEWKSDDKKSLLSSLYPLDLFSPFFYG